MGETNQTRLVISIQSQVVHGHVGNSAAVFPMQAEGLAVAAVPTTLLSNHPHYPTTRGRVLEPQLVNDLLLGVEERGLVEKASILLTGYLGSVANAEVVAAFVARARKSNPSLLYVCDPVVGDDDVGIFVADGLLEAFRDTLVPMASAITPNQFELELLSGLAARSAPDLRVAAAALADGSRRSVIATGCTLEDTPVGKVETILCEPHGLSRTATDRLPIRPCGTGDLFTALFVAGLAKGLPAAEACRRATVQVFRILERTKDGEEMQLTPWPWA
ncbi:pyridoxal kinase [Mesorhizobium sp. 1B3]|uniref:pyridoxal kinase n=1 Tax=Mesorhizobium sp. 1B3 TaxID=3243599 RepID=UPI003D96919C